MPKSFSAKIPNRELQVRIDVMDMNEYELAFLGKEPEKAVQEHKIPDQVIRMWDLDEDPQGSEAEKVFILAVQLLEKGKTIEEVFKKIVWLVRQIMEEEKKIDEMIRSIR